MKGILILAHGSKRVETENIVESIAQKVRQKTGEKLVLPAYLQFSEVNLEKGINKLIEMGATDIKIMPMFLFDGVHVTEDIPNELVEIRQKNPGIKIEMTSHIGDDDRIADIVIDRVNGL
jgi:sirohydrochlorin ferrochelatase